MFPKGTTNNHPHLPPLVATPTYRISPRQHLRGSRATTLLFTVPHASYNSSLYKNRSVSTSRITDILPPPWSSQLSCRRPLTGLYTPVHHRLRSRLLDVEPRVVRLSRSTLGASYRRHVRMSRYHTTQAFLEAILIHSKYPLFQLQFELNRI